MAQNADEANIREPGATDDRSSSASTFKGDTNGVSLENHAGEATHDDDRTVSGATNPAHGSTNNGEDTHGAGHGEDDDDGEGNGAGTAQAAREEVTVVNDKLLIRVKDQHQNEVTFNLKPATTMGKLMTTYCERENKDVRATRFMFDGRRVLFEDTPESLEMEDGDVVDAYAEQYGGAGSLYK